MHSEYYLNGMCLWGESQQSQLGNAVCDLGRGRGRGVSVLCFAVCFYGEMIHGLWLRYLPNYDMLY